MKKTLGESGHAAVLVLEVSTKRKSRPPASTRGTASFRYHVSAVCTGFVSALPQYIVPAKTTSAERSRRRKTHVECSSSVCRQRKLLSQAITPRRIAASQGSGRSTVSADHTSPDGVLDCNIANSSPSALSFLLAGTSLPVHDRRGATALPRTLVASVATNMSEPSLEPPLALPHEFYSGHAPTLRLLARHRHAYFHMADQAMHRVAKPGGRSASCVSVGL